MLQAVALARKAAAIDWIVAQHGAQVNLPGKSALNKRSKQFAVDLLEPYDAHELLPLFPADSNSKSKIGNTTLRSCIKPSK